MDLVMNRRTFLHQSVEAVGTDLLPMEAELASVQSIEANAGIQSGEEKDTPLPRLLRTTAGLEPYTGSWDFRHASHLLHRTMIGPKLSEVNTILGMTVSQAVDMLLQNLPLPTPPIDPTTGTTWVNNAPYTNPTTEQKQQYRTWLAQLRQWWVSQMLNQSISIRERMTLFWHNHFVSEAKKVSTPQLMYQQNNLLRQNALGNVRNFAKAVSKDPAMLWYLDGKNNLKGKINENYARELQELFTIGIGNYTQQDVAEAGRALSGWQIDGLNAVFNPNRHDAGNKTFYSQAITGKTGTAGATETDSVVDIIFQKEETAKFLCRKLYRHFVYNVPDETIIAQSADILRQNNYEIKPVLSTLLKSAHFFDDTTIGAQIKSPVELVVGTVRQLGVQNFPLSNLVNTASTLGQFVLDPPNVAGWPGYRAWISTTTLPQRGAATDSYVNGVKEGTVTYKVDALGFARTFPQPDNAVQLVNDLAALFFPAPLTSTRIQLLMNTLLQGLPAYEWSTQIAGADARLRSLLKFMMRMPEFQLT
jgi:uncharacterized protein (DUF1800 family)